MQQKPLNDALPATSGALSALVTVCIVQLENLAHLQQKDKAHQQQDGYLAKISKLQAALQEATERSGKIRQQYERYFPSYLHH